MATTRGLVAIEALNVRSMTASARGTVDQPGINVRQKAGLNREILERGWGELHRQLAYKAMWYGSQLVQVPAAYSSQTCSRCETIDRQARDSQAAAGPLPGHPSAHLMMGQRRLTPDRVWDLMMRAQFPTPKP